MRELPSSKYATTGNISDMNDFTRDQVLAIQKQAYEDGLRDALPAQPEEKHLLAILRVDNPALFKEGLRGESDGLQTTRMIEALIRKAEKQYAAIFTASQKETK